MRIEKRIGEAMVLCGFPGTEKLRSLVRSGLVWVGVGVGVNSGCMGHGSYFRVERYLAWLGEGSHWSVVEWIGR